MIDANSERKVSRAVPLGFVLGLGRGHGNVTKGPERAGHLPSFYHQGTHEGGTGVKQPRISLQKLQGEFIV